MNDERAPLRAVPGPPRKVGDMAQKSAEAYSVHISKILHEDSTEIKFLVPGCIPRGNIVLLSGASGARKSWVAYDLAKAVCQGKGWLEKDMPCPDGPLPVVILNYDNPTETLRTRLKKLGFTENDPCWIHTLGHTTPYVPNAPAMLTLPSEASRLRYMLEYWKPALIIFDSFRQGVTLDENDAEKMASLMAIFKSWIQFNNTTIVLIHHTSKSGKSATQPSDWAEARGSGEIIASSDVVLKASQIDQHSGKLEWTKCRTWNIGRTSSLEFEIRDEFKDGGLSEEDGLDPEELREIEMIQRVHVRAKTPLPFELEMIAVNRVMDELSRATKPFLGFKELQKRITDLNDTALKEALRNARVLGRARFVASSAGKGYCIKPQP